MFYTSGRYSLRPTLEFKDGISSSFRVKYEKLQLVITQKVI
jgi:hypothetical protein